MKWYLKCLKQYADFGGRARRSEYWFFVLFNLINIIAIYIAIVFMTMVGGMIMFAIGLAILYAYTLAVLVPGIAVGVRRLHDVGKSGWFLLIGLIPIIGGLFLFVLSCQDSQPGSNQWGANPKDALQ